MDILVFVKQVPDDSVEIHLTGLAYRQSRM